MVPSEAVRFLEVHQVEAEGLIGYDDAIERRRHLRSVTDEEPVGTVAARQADRQPRSAWLHLKRFFDVVLALGGLVALAPLLAVVALLVKATSDGPVFFLQTRLGRGARPFKMLKFRTMVKNAEELKAALAAQNEATGPVFKMRHDPRLTRIGGVLRKFSIDELPQLWNVVRGDMTLVGPRPPVPEEVVKYRRWQMRRLGVTPGLTCIWQVSGRSKIGFEDWTRMDIRYIERQSLWLDVKILWRTIAVVVRGDGAY